MRFVVSCLIVFSFGVTSAQVNFSYYQSPVYKPTPGSTSQARAVCSMMETCLGAPDCFDAGRLSDSVKASGGRNLLVHYRDYLEFHPIWPCAPASILDANQITRYMVPIAASKHLGGSKASNPDQVKALLDRGVKSIAVNYSLPAKTWKSLKKSQARLLEPKHFFKKGSATPKGGRQDSLVLVAVNVVGFDEQGFWIKGTEGPGWGDAGYARISYGLHEAAAKEVFAAYMVEASFPNLRGANHLHHFGLRIFPEKIEGKPMAQLAVVEQALLPVSPVTHLDYKVWEVGSDSLQAQVYKSLVSEITCSSGFPVFVPVSSHDATIHVLLRYRCANGEVGSVNFRDQKIRSGHAQGQSK